jgi:hypothetical protein
VSAGLSLRGQRWGREADTVGFAANVGGLSPNHRRFLQAGEIGFVTGDGRLRYRPEAAMEAYYDLRLAPGLNLTADLQLIANLVAVPSITAAEVVMVMMAPAAAEETERHSRSTPVWAVIGRGAPIGARRIGVGRDRRIGRQLVPIRNHALHVGRVVSLLQVARRCLGVPGANSRTCQQAASRANRGTCSGVATRRPEQGACACAERCTHGGAADCALVRCLLRRAAADLLLRVAPAATVLSLELSEILPLRWEQQYVGSGRRRHGAGTEAESSSEYGDRFEAWHDGVSPTRFAAA